MGSSRNLRLAAMAVWRRGSLASLHHEHNPRHRPNPGPERQLRVAGARAAKRRGRVVDPAVAGPVLAEAEAPLEDHAHPEHPSSRRPCRRQPRDQGGDRLHHRRPRPTARAFPASTSRSTTATAIASARPRPRSSSCRATPAATSPMPSASRRPCSAATRCSPWAAAAVRGHAGADVDARSAACARCPTTRGSTARTSTRSRTPASRSPSRPTTGS